MPRQQTTEQTLPFIRHIVTALFPGQDTAFLETVFGKARELFAGKHPGYQRCDTAYHDFSHTCDVAITTGRILDGHIRSRETPLLTKRDFELAMAAALLHDSGLIKEAVDTFGTGAKYTSTHVGRSVVLAGKFLPLLGVKPDELCVVQLAIRSTEIKVDVSRLEFRNERERFLGCALGAGDLLGQMAAADYPERLPLLYAEFQEVATGYTNVEDMLRLTRNFYETHVRRLLNTQWAGVQRALTHHFPSGRNEVLEAIEENLTRIDLALGASKGSSQREHHHV